MLALKIVATVALAVMGVSLFLAVTMSGVEKRGSAGYKFIVICMFVQALAIGVIWAT